MRFVFITSVNGTKSVFVGGGRLVRLLRNVSQIASVGVGLACT